MTINSAFGPRSEWQTDHHRALGLEISEPCVASANPLTSKYEFSLSLEQLNQKILISDDERRPKNFLEDCSTMAGIVNTINIFHLLFVVQKVSVRLTIDHQQQRFGLLFAIFSFYSITCWFIHSYTERWPMLGHRFTEYNFPSPQLHLHSQTKQKEIEKKKKKN